MTLQNTLDQLHERSFDKYEFRDMIKNENQKDVVNRLYTSRFIDEVVKSEATIELFLIYSIIVELYFLSQILHLVFH